MNSSEAPTTVTKIGVAMFTVADQDAALAFYTEKLGFEVRSDVSFGEGGAMRWLGGAPRGSRARRALTPPMNSTPGGGAIGIETADLKREHERLSAIGDVDVDAEVMSMPGTPSMF